jgi:hypothetical protein
VTEAIVTIWWIGLVLALLLTIPAIAIVVRFVHHAREIDRLARVTLAGAVGIAGNTARISALDELLTHAAAVASTCAAIDGVAAKIHRHGAAVVRALSAAGSS